MKGRAVIGALAALWAVGAAAQPASLDWQEVVTRVVRDQPSLEAARLQAERARLELQKLEASLGWVFQGSATASHDVSFIGTPSDSVQGRAGVQRRQANGVTWGMGGSYTYQNDSFVFSPLLPNPYHYFTWDVNARIPLGQGQGNPDYHLGRQQAGAAEEMARLARDEQRDALAAQAIDLYFAAAFTRERILNAKAGIEFSERIRAYILRNMELGLFEDKDRLQIEAQLAGQRAQHRALETAWVEQRTALNQLMNRPWDTPFLPRIDLNDAPLPDLERLVARALAYDPQLARLRARLTQVDAAIARARAARAGRRRWARWPATTWPPSSRWSTATPWTSPPSTPSWRRRASTPRWCRSRCAPVSAPCATASPTWWSRSAPIAPPWPASARRWRRSRHA